MADNSLEVKITADVTSLQAKAAVAKSELAELNSSVKSLAGQFANASDAMKATLAPQLDAAAKQAAETRAELAALNAEMREQPGEGGMFAKLMEGMEGTTQRFEGLTEKMQGFSKLTGAVTEFVMAGLAVEKVADAFKETAEMGEQLSQMASKFGMPVEAISGLRVVAIQTGTDFDSVGQAMAKLGSTMQEAVQSPTSKSAAAFREMGISVTDASGQLRPMQDVMQQVAAKIADYQDGTAKAALVSDLFGTKAGDNLIPLLNELGEQGFSGATDKARQFGVLMTGVQTQMDTQFNVSLKNVGLGMEGLRDSMVQGAIPGATLLAQDFVQLTEQGGVLHDAALAVGVGLDVVVATADVAGAIVVDLSVTVQAFGETLDAVVYSAEALGEAMTGNFKAAAVAGEEATQTLETAWTNAASKIGKSWTDVGASMKGMYQSTLTELTGQEAPEKPKEESHKEVAPTIDKAALDSGKKAADEQLQISKDAAEAEKQIQQSVYQAQVSNWDAEVAQGKITKAQEIQNEIAAQQQIYNAQLAEMEKEAQLAGLSAVQKAKALDNISVYQAQHNAEMARLSEELVAQQVNDAKKVQQEQEKAAKASEEAWQRAFQPIQQAFDSSINGVLQGTETLRQAEMKAAQSITLAFIDTEAKKLMAFVASEARQLAVHAATQMSMTEATEAGAVSRLGAQASADAAGKSMSLAQAVSEMNTNAVRAAGGAYAAVAGIPYIGPVLAPVAAATAYAGVMAFDVLSAEGGTVIPANVNPLVQLHEQEMVLPAHIAQPLLSMVSGDNLVSNGGDTTHVNNTFHLSANGSSKGLSHDDVLSVLNTAVRSGSLQKYPAIARMMRRGG